MELFLFDTLLYLIHKNCIPGCSISAIADLVFLVDGSWSVGRNNFKYILDFIVTLVSAFDIGEDKTRVGIVQYSTDTRTEFNLNQYFNQRDLTEAIKRIPYKGGNTMTGMYLLTLSDVKDKQTMNDNQVLVTFPCW